MYEFLFLIFLGLILFLLSYFGIKKFPSERFQFLLAIPYKQISDGRWLSLNLTYYGLFNAIAYTLGSLVTTILLLSINIKIIQIFLIMLFTFIICIPSSKYVAYFIEKTKSGFTVGGAVFIGVLISPIAIIVSLYLTGFKDQSTSYIIPILTSLSIGYILGEGIGRIGCLSFGCCYGKSVDSLSDSFLKKIFGKWNTVYTGRLKKASYASNLCEQKTVPVQAMSIILYNTTGLISIILFIKGYYIFSLILVTFVSQLYRFFSEFLRADYRGEGKISAYQKMSIINVILITFYTIIFKSSLYPLAKISTGLLGVFNPVAMTIFAVLFLFTLIYTGISSVTYSITNFRLSSKVITKK
ncbi:MAG: prolipoprotein diacylglyceryl transferase [Calditerrivibrio sp.]|nr:prolipoprotein diacylglyceryl transferase [Calditerrivibrio sp.]